MNSIPKKSNAGRPEIVALAVASFAEQFQSGCWDHLKYLVAKLEQDIVWEALRIQADTTTWGVTEADYIIAMTIISPSWTRINALTKTNK